MHLSKLIISTQKRSLDITVNTVCNYSKKYKEDVRIHAGL